MQPARPPRLARALVRALAPPPLREQIDGDVAEGFELRCARDGDAAARRWYWRQLVSLDVIRLHRELGAPRRPHPRRRQRMHLGDLVRDLRFALRTLGNNPAYTAVVVITLALAIGVNTALFTVVDAVLLRPLPYEDSERLAMVFRTVPRFGFTRSVVSYPDFRDWRQQSESFTDLAAYAYDSAVHAGVDGAEQWEGYRVTAGLFALLGVEPARGRAFEAAEDRPGAEPVVLLSHAVWRERFGADERIIGRAVRLDNEDHVVVGIMPAGFAFPAATATYWVPLRGNAELMERDTNFLSVIGRLSPGVTVARAQAEMERLSGAIDATPGGNEGYGVFVERRHDFVVRNARAALGVFGGAVAMILIVACANVANVMLVRGLARRRELAVRAALGAGRRRLGLLLFGESALLAAGGGALGLLLCFGLVRALLVLEPGALPRASEVGVDATTLAFTAALALGSSIGFGTLPVLLGSRADLLRPLRAGAGGTRGRFTRRLQQGFVVVQVALAMVVLVGSALLANSFLRLTSVEPGFDPDNVVAARVAPPEPLTQAQTSTGAGPVVEPPAARARFFADLLTRVRALPGVESAGLAYDIPFGRNNFSRFVVPEGMEVNAGEEPVIAGNIVAGDYLRTMGIAVERGRGLSDADTADSVPVALVNESMAALFWPGQEAVGKRLRIGEGEGPWVTVVGVVADTRVRSLEEAPEPLYYRPLSQAAWPAAMFVAARSTRPAAELVTAIRAQVRSLDARVPLTDVATAGELVRASVAGARFRTLVLSLFGLMAASLALVGLYGVVAHAVGARVREIGVRRALGADDARVTGMVLGSGLGLAAIGIGLGALVGVALTRFLTGMLFAITPSDPVTFVVVGCALAAAAAFACLMPARRALRANPSLALRGD